MHELVVGRAAEVALVAVLVGISALLRTRILDASFWIDEGLSVGIASHALGDIPELLRQDGSPPLYYLLLHVWIGLAGRSEEATHLLSLIPALLTIPVAYWAGGSMFGRRVAWIAAGLAALNPFLTIYAQETRMYSLVVLLSLLGTAAFLHAFVLGHRRYVPVFALVLTLLLYTHNWALFFALGAVAALVVLLRKPPGQRPRALDGVLAFGAAGLSFAPWVPTLLFQAVHTGAPWSSAPSPGGLLGGPSALLSGQGSAVALLLAGGSGLVTILKQPGSRERDAVVALLVLAGGTLLTAWLFSQFSPAWANRYLAVILGPLLLLAAVALARAGRLGVVALILVLALWASYRASDEKSNAREVAADLAPLVQPGDLVVSTHPEQVPVLEYYLPPGLRYATPLGNVSDPGVMDWRDAVERLRAADPRTELAPLLDDLPAGSSLVLVRPVVEDTDGWRAEWTRLVVRRSRQWSGFVAADSRFVRAGRAPRVFQETFKGVRAVVYRKAADG